MQLRKPVHNFRDPLIQSFAAHGLSIAKQFQQSYEKGRAINSTFEIYQWFVLINV
ncbi:hypothetical protein CEV32_2608 [Brucella rhizosphaerae]|uniref:Uncharacterized protein n=1 Tax=Brucella rhizosphaerae TaxID=571254 RepID=A0A256F6X2_9HYPH|nr:hypothetical protein CEV32_2608 [Brucella rhizosphaerae]